MNGLIVFVNGGPGTGKSYMARQLCDRYAQLQLFSYDALKEVFWDRYGFSNGREKRKIDDLSLEYFYEELDQKMKDHENVVTDYPFYQRHKDRLEQLVRDNGYAAVCILLSGDRHVIYERQKQRDDSGRHPAHLTDHYDPNRKDQPVRRYDYSEDEFWQKIAGKDYDIRIGETFYIDVSDLDGIDLEPAAARIATILGEINEQASGDA